MVTTHKARRGGAIAFWQLHTRISTSLLQVYQDLQVLCFCLLLTKIHLKQHTRSTLHMGTAYKEHISNGNLCSFLLRTLKVPNSKGFNCNYRRLVCSIQQLLPYVCCQLIPQGDNNCLFPAIRIQYFQNKV
jgi:hypothetical protein